MKLLLTSSGFTTPEITKACVRLVGKPQSKINVALINESYAPERYDKRWSINEMKNVADTMGGMVDMINLLALPSETIRTRLEPADVIYVLGGHVDYLMHVFQKSGLANMLPGLLASKVYVGSSASSMIMGRRVSAEAYLKFYAEEGTYGVTKYLEFVDFAIKPHRNNPDFPNHTRRNILEVSQTYDSAIYSLEDDQAIQVTDGEIAFIGGMPLIARHGEATE